MSGEVSVQTLWLIYMARDCRRFSLSLLIALAILVILLARPAQAASVSGDTWEPRAPVQIRCGPTLCNARGIARGVLPAFARFGKGLWPDAPPDVHTCRGYQNGIPGIAVLPAQDVVISLNDTRLDRYSLDPLDPVFKDIMEGITDTAGR